MLYRAAVGHFCQAHAGTLLSKQELEYASDLCRRVGAYLVLDNTYEHFTYDCRQHHCVSAPHVLHIFSFSKVKLCLCFMTVSLFCLLGNEAMRLLHACSSAP